MRRRTSAAPMRDRLPRADWHGISACHVRCAAERKSTRAKLRFAVRERAYFAPENKYEIDGQQKKLRLDSVAILCDRIGQVIWDWVDDERRGERQPSGRPAREGKEETQPT